VGHECDPYVEMSAHDKVQVTIPPVTFRIRSHTSSEGNLYQGEGRLQCFERALCRPSFLRPLRAGWGLLGGRGRVREWRSADERFGDFVCLTIWRGDAARGGG
jgi:hypothetical protein